MKVLEVNVDDIGMGGVFSLVRNVIANRGENMQIDIATIEPFENADNIKNLSEMGCTVFYVGYSNSKILKQFVCFRNLRNLLKRGNYDCAHIHADVANKLFVSGLACKYSGVKKIILHSHASSVDGNHRWMKQIYHRICRRILKYIATDYASCSDLAAKWMFPNVRSDNIKMINNGIKLDLFRYNIAIRNEIRNKLNVNDKYVVGHVGRFAYQKNHEYLIDVFAKVKKSLPSAILLLIGEGVLLDNIKEKVKSLGLSQDVIFYGLSNRVYEMLQAMDTFVLPSHFEGLPIVGVEAQAAGLPVIFSSEITREAKQINEVHYLPIDRESINIWADYIVKLSKYKRYDTHNELLRQGFDIQQTIRELIDLYMK